MITGKIRETPLGGLTSTLSDYDCADGDMQICHNMISDGAGLKPIADALVKFTLPDDMDKCVFVHKTTETDIYIVTGTDGSLYAYKESDAGLTEVTFPQSQFRFGDDDSYSISSVGNVLLVSIHGGDDEDGLLYYRFVNDKQGGRYDDLGRCPPDIDLRFFLGQDPARTENTDDPVFKYSFSTDTVIDDVGDAVNKRLCESLTAQDAVMGAVNKMVDDMKEDNLFLRPFLVRYAYKMYDGSYTNVSSPVLMEPSDWYNPFVPYSLSGKTLNWFCLGFGSRCWATINAKTGEKPGFYDELKNWEDVITDICVFVTPQILNYSETGSELQSETDLTANDIGQRISDYGRVYLHSARVFDSEDVSNIFPGYGKILLPYKREGTMNEWIAEAANFYLVTSLGLQEFLDKTTAATAFSWQVKSVYSLRNIETFEKLPDAYRSRTLLVPSVIHSYNHRLSIANVTEREKQSFPVGDFSCIVKSASGGGALPVSTRVTVYIEEHGLYMTAEAAGFGIFVDSNSYWADLTQMPGFFYYPNPNAKYVHISVADDAENMAWYEDGSKKLTVPDLWIDLKPHPSMDGAYYYHPYYEDYRTLVTPFVNEEPAAIQDWEETSCLDRDNYLYTSEVDNPFVFPSSNVEAVGNGEITAIKEATKAVSEGTAFGAMPLYVFCTDGIWALEVGSTGTYTAKQPVSRETLLGDDAGCATQIDNSILFLSDRGLMELNGGSTRVLSGALQGRDNIAGAERMDRWDDIHSMFGDGEYMDADGFIDFIKKGGARIAFDYESYRAVVYRDGEGVAYVYDIGAKAWATVDNRIKSSLEGFPSTLLNLKRSDGKTDIGVFALESGELVGDGKAFYLTRPLKLGEADTLKTVRTLVERGVRGGGGLKYLALWGSRDMRSWSLVADVKGGRIPRLGGTPYKWFAVGGWTEFTAVGERVSRLTVESVDKYTDRIR